MQFIVQEIEKIIQGKLIQGSGRVRIKGVSINSKTVKKGDLFIAIKGERFDGHQFINQAIRRGAAAVVVSRKKAWPNKKTPIIHVKKTVEALGHLGRAHRDRFSIPMIALTGSAGKTTTKEMTAAILKGRFKVLKNKGTQNNHIGVPMTLLGLKKSHEIVVLELGTNRFGDIPWLTYVCNPTVAIFTNIGESHLELLKSPKDVFREKSALVSKMKAGGTVILNNDDRFLKKLPMRYKRHKFITYGITNKAHHRASSIQLKNNALRFKVDRKNWINLNTPAMANIYNALAAISCSRLFNISYNNINRNINKAGFAQGRQQIRKVRGCWIIDDTYNANPLSMRSALQTLRCFKAKGRKIFVCADMMELGVQAEKMHSSIGKVAADSQLDLILTHGRFSKYVTQAAKREKNNLLAYHCRTLDQMHKKLLQYCEPGDVILVKGSRGMHMERTVDFFVKNFRN